MRRVSIAAFACLGCLVLAPPRLVWAAEPSQRQEIALAERHHAEATRLYQAGNFAAARVEFQAAYDLSREPDILHNLSLVAEKQGKLDESIALEERFKAERGAEITQGERDGIDGRIARLRQSATVPVAQSATSSGRRPPLGSIVLMAGGGALLITGIGCGIGAVVTGNHVRNDGPFPPNEKQALLNQGQALQSTGIAFDVLGGAALIAGVSWAIVDRVRRPASR